MIPKKLVAREGPTLDDAIAMIVALREEVRILRADLAALAQAENHLE
jgi:hypothetical protein